MLSIVHRKVKSAISKKSASFNLLSHKKSCVVKVMCWVGQAQLPVEDMNLQMKWHIAYCVLEISIAVELQGG